MKDNSGAWQFPLFSLRTVAFQSPAVLLGLKLVSKEQQLLESSAVIRCRSGASNVCVGGGDSAAGAVGTGRGR